MLFITPRNCKIRIKLCFWISLITFESLYLTPALHGALLATRRLYVFSIHFKFWTWKLLLISFQMRFYALQTKFNMCTLRNYSSKMKSLYKNVSKNMYFENYYSSILKISVFPNVRVFYIRNITCREVE